MHSINNTLTLINEYWSAILIILVIAFIIFTKIRKFMSLSEEEQIEATLKIVKEELLKLMSDAEVEWMNWKKSGVLKKSQVIGKIYEHFPILKDYINQDELIEKISTMIDEEMLLLDVVINKAIEGNSNNTN